MKRFMRRVLSVVMAAMVLTGAGAAVADAKAGSVVVHVKDGENWGSMNLYNWGDAGETAGVWPGTAMTAEKEDGWYTYTLETEVDLHLVFSAAGGSPQSSDIDPIAPDAGEVWVVVGGEGAQNPLSGGEAAGTALYLEPEEGFPVAAAETQAAETEAAEAKTEVPKTGEGTSALAVFLLASAAVSLTMAAVMKKKEKTSAN